MNDKHIRMARGESRSYRCTVTSDSVAYSLNGCSLSFTVKSKLTHTDGQALFQLYIGSGITINNTTGGIYTLDISAANTSLAPKDDSNLKYYFDHRIKTSAGGVKQLEAGEFVITPNVTDTIV